MRGGWGFGCVVLPCRQAQGFPSCCLMGFLLLLLLRLLRPLVPLVAADPPARPATPLLPIPRLASSPRRPLSPRTRPLELPRRRPASPLRPHRRARLRCLARRPRRPAPLARLHPRPDDTHNRARQQRRRHARRRASPPFIKPRRPLARLDRPRHAPAPPHAALLLLIPPSPNYQTGRRPVVSRRQLAQPRPHRIPGGSPPPADGGVRGALHRGDVRARGLVLLGVLAGVGGMFCCGGAGDLCGPLAHLGCVDGGGGRGGGFVGRVRGFWGRGDAFVAASWEGSTGGGEEGGSGDDGDGRRGARRGERDGEDDGGDGRGRRGVRRAAEGGWDGREGLAEEGARVGRRSEEDERVVHLARESGHGV